MEDKTLQCIDCKQDFDFTKGEQEFYQDKGFTPPKRCKVCRDKKKQERGNTGRDSGWDGRNSW